MKMYTHAWLALKALELLDSYRGQFDDKRNKRLNRLVKFMYTYPSTFLRGAWLPDSVIRDNIRGGHTWKYCLDSANGRIEIKRPPLHNKCFNYVKADLDKKVSLEEVISDLPDRCEALSQTIRDAILITNNVKKGDVVAFNNTQIAILFLLLSHYVCDAHAPVHCDSRDFYKPSKVHPDLEKFWEEEIFEYYRVSKKRKQFDLNENQKLERDTKKRDYEKSILGKCDEILRQSAWCSKNRSGDNWRIFLGKGNKNLWDYLVSVCLVSFHMSLKMFPLNPPPAVDYDTVRIMDVSPFREDVRKYSPYILADAINSVALVWLATWDRWELLAKDIR